MVSSSASKGGPERSEVAVVLVQMAPGFADLGFAVRYLKVYPENEPQRVTFRALAPALIKAARAEGPVRTM